MIFILVLKASLKTIKNSFKDGSLFYCFGIISSVVLALSLFYAQPLFDLAQTNINIQDCSISINKSDIFSNQTFNGSFDFSFILKCKNTEFESESNLFIRSNAWILILILICAFIVVFSIFFSCIWYKRPRISTSFQ
jgi:hypothetical protein